MIQGHYFYFILFFFPRRWVTIFLFIYLFIFYL